MAPLGKLQNLVTTFPSKFLQWHAKAQGQKEPTPCPMIRVQSSY